MGLAERRKALGYSQEHMAELLGVDRTTVGRWECAKTAPQPHQRLRLAEVLGLGLTELDVVLRVAEPQRTSVSGSAVPRSQEESDEMIRREFLRVLAMSGALAALPGEEAAALAEGARRGTAEDFTRMNAHLWQVYQLARSKGSVRPVVRDQLETLNEALGAAKGGVQPYLRAAADLFQLAGEVAFDANRYADAAGAYAMAASVSRDAHAYDLWACALIRHAYVDVAEHRYREARDMLAVAERLAGRGDPQLATRYWVASVQAQAHAGLGELLACERALDRAEQVRGLAVEATPGGWLRFDVSRLAEERGARYVSFERLDLAESVLREALDQHALATGPSYRRRGAVLTDLASIGVKRRDPEQVLAYGGEAARLAQASSSGYVARRLRDLRTRLTEFGPDRRVLELGDRIDSLHTG
ncbi:MULTISPECIES: helix-turn-helix transcriptional regulator [Streptomyces]|uniref:helix-turn-helix transcriptional regulator n=1 Tax=Streptomyces TaxID=1883 RepID=UPI002884E067|nr:helix-turn-helix transcriptional regulator [Streptomyces sp. DSM 41859]MDT0423815.1 helix-turn-helix transcriptional regulator [Streptomyces sp. DSM 41859]